MYLTSLQTIGIIVAVALGTMITRFLPFLLFPEHKKIPEYIQFLGKALPTAMMGLLVAYCLKGVNIIKGSHGLTELLAIGVILILHRLKNNVLLSIGGGTIVYMLLVQLVF